MNPPTPRLFGMHVLLVGTDAATTSTVRASLAAEGAVITVLAAVGDAIAFLRHCIPHLVVVDISGPAITADTVLSSIRSLGQPAGEPAAHEIGQSLSLGPISALAAGLPSSPAKPVDVIVLSRMVRRMRLP